MTRTELEQTQKRSVENVQTLSEYLKTESAAGKTAAAEQMALWSAVAVLTEIALRMPELAGTENKPL
jgi:hypothetical protein